MKQEQAQQDIKKKRKIPRYKEKKKDQYNMI